MEPRSDRPEAARRAAGNRKAVRRAAGSRKAVRRRAAGFTLIEIMAVVLIMGLLAGLVGVAIFGQIDSARVTTTKTQMKQIEQALTFYQMDNGRFPTTEQGLEALVREPSVGPEPRNYRPGGYLQGDRVPRDAWGNPYQYENPGQNNPHSFDLWSLGADGSPGGSDTDADIGNWSDDTREAGEPR